MRIDSVECCAFSFMYRNTQFHTKIHSTFRMKKVMTLGKVTLKHSKYLMHVKRAYVLDLQLAKELFIIE